MVSRNEGGAPFGPTYFVYDRQYSCPALFVEPHHKLAVFVREDALFYLLPELFFY